jgi:hypothetical protein
MMREFIISEEFANQVIKYLVSKPYEEVWALIMGFQKLSPVTEKRVADIKDK